MESYFDLQKYDIEKLYEKLDEVNKRLYIAQTLGNKQTLIQQIIVYKDLLQQVIEEKKIMTNIDSDSVDENKYKDGVVFDSEGKKEDKEKETKKSTSEQQTRDELRKQYLRDHNKKEEGDNGV